MGGRQLISERLAQWILGRTFIEFFNQKLAEAIFQTGDDFRYSGEDFTCSKNDCQLGKRVFPNLWQDHVQHTRDEQVVKVRCSGDQQFFYCQFNEFWLMFDIAITNFNSGATEVLILTDKDALGSYKEKGFSLEKFTYSLKFQKKLGPFVKINSS